MLDSLPRWQEVFLSSLTLHIYYTQGFRILQELSLLLFVWLWEMESNQPIRAYETRE